MPRSNLLEYVGFVQMPVLRGQPFRNLLSLQETLQKLQPPQGSLLLLPELWGTGFAYQELTSLTNSVDKLYEELQGLALKYALYLVGSLPEICSERANYFYNALTIVGADGSFGTCRKRHLFPGEEAAFHPWPLACSPIHTPVGSFGTMICYDIRFPEIARSQCQQGADMLLCVAQWPTKRISHLRALAVARAIENQTYVVVCNAVGWNGDLELGGQSLVISPDGNILCEGGSEANAQIVSLCWSVKDEVQRSFRSFALAPFTCSAQMKMVKPEDCLEDVKNRCRAGQRIIYYRLAMGEPVHAAIDRLERARRLGDYLIVAVDFGTSKDQNPTSSEEHLLKNIAALGCVDAILPFATITPDVDRCLRQYSYRIEP